MPQVGRLRYLLVIILICLLMGWPEAFPVTSATTGSVIKVLLEQITPRYGIVEAIDSEELISQERFFKELWLLWE